MDIISRKEAKELGLKFYFTGKQCKYGHIAERRTSNGFCLGCESEKDYREYKTEIAKKHYSENKEHRSLLIKQWADNNRNKVRSYKNKWSANNIEYFKEYYAENKTDINAKNSEYKKQNKDIVCAYNSFRRAAKRNATPVWLSKEHLKEIRKFYTLASSLSNTTGIKHHVDHIVPLISAFVCGLHVPWNLQVITEYENLSKGNKYNQDIIT